MRQRTPNLRSRRTRILGAAVVLTLAAGALAIQRPAAEPAPSSSATAAAAANYAKLPLAFEPNQGQADPSVEYLVHHGGAETRFGNGTVETRLDGHAVTMSLIGARTPEFAPSEPLPGSSNYFIGSNPDQWHTGVPTFGRLTAAGVYPGIDLTYYGTNTKLEHDFVVAPGAAYQQIAFKLTSSQQPALDADGNLTFPFGDTELRLDAPVTYQQSAHERHTVPSRFVLDGDVVRIALAGEYDHSQPLVIDPALVYSTFLGGSDDDQGAGIAVDSAGNAYIEGTANSTNFPITGGAYQQTSTGGSPYRDVFVSKLSADGLTLMYSTYLGGNGSDIGFGVAVDSGGNAYAIGSTGSVDFPTAAPFQGSGAGFITKLDPSGSSLVYSSYVGGSGGFAAGVAVDSSDNAYVVGRTGSDLPTVAAIQPTYGGGGEDGYVVKVDSSGSSVVYATYLGGSDADNTFGVAVNAAGVAYVTGSTASSDFPVNAAFQPSYGGGTQDAFLAKIDAAGSSLVYSSYLGGSADEQGTGIGIDASGDAMVSGQTGSSDFPTLSALQGSYAGGEDSYVTKVDASGSLLYSTYLGGSGNELGFALTADSAGNAYPAGVTCSTDFPLEASIQSLTGGCFAYVSKLNPSGSAFVYSTALGGTGFQFALAVAVGQNGNAYITGQTSSADFPTAQAFQPAYGGGGADVYVAQINDAAITVTGTLDSQLSFSLGSTVCDLGRFSPTQTKFCTHTMSASTNAANGYVISYIPTTTLTSGANTVTAMASQAASALTSEQFGFNLRANTASGSHAASNFGADASGGSGSPLTGYNLPDLFKFAVGGDDIAQAVTGTNTTVYTVSYIANIDYLTDAGTYSTPITYTIVASY